MHESTVDDPRARSGKRRFELLMQACQLLLAHE